MGGPRNDFDPLEKEMGPKMRALNERQRKFVVALATYGRNFTRAAADAGYSATSQNGLEVQGWRLAHDSRVLDAFDEYCEKRLRQGKGLALNVMFEVAGTSGHKDQFRAAQAILDRTGMHAKSEHTVKVEDNSLTDKALLARVKQLAANLGWDQAQTRTLLLENGLDPKVIEGEFEVVVDPVTLPTDDWE